MESGPILDRSLSCCDRGRRENLLYQEPLEEIESLGVAAMVLKADSAFLEADCLLLAGLGDVRL